MGEEPAGVGGRAGSFFNSFYVFCSFLPSLFPTLCAPLLSCSLGAQGDPHQLLVTAVPVSLSHQRATVTTATGCPQREGRAERRGALVGPSHKKGVLIVLCTKQGGCVLDPAW